MVPSSYEPFFIFIFIILIFIPQQRKKMEFFYILKEKDYVENYEALHLWFLHFESEICKLDELTISSPKVNKYDLQIMDGKYFA